MELRSQLMQFEWCQLSHLKNLLETRPVVPEKYVIALIVKCDNSSASIHRSLWEETCEHPRYSMPQSCIEIIQNHLWIVLR